MTTETQNYLEQAYQHEAAGDFKAALAACDAALSLDPHLAPAHNFRGLVLEALGRRREALAAYEQAHQLAPDFKEAADNFAELKTELADSNGLVILTTFNHPNDAYVLKSRLEAEGIWTFLTNENLINTNWFYSFALGGVKLLVKEDDAERAAEILHQEAEATDWDEEEVWDEEVEDEFEEAEELDE